METAPVAPEEWAFLDETGRHGGYTPTHAWVPRGQRASASALRNKGGNKTVIAALTLDGDGALMRFDGPMTTTRFEGYVRFILAPTLRKGHLVAADYLTAHHTLVVCAAIEARGAELRHLPTYSPDFNPIEETCSKVKQSLRRAQARTDDDIRAATWTAFAPTDSAGCFTHCGCRPNDRSS